MMHRCQKCNDVNEKTLDTLSQEYVHEGNKYWHMECYINKLMESKKMSREDAIVEAFRIIDLNLDVTTEEKNKDRVNDIVLDICGLDKTINKKEIGFFNICLENLRKGIYKNKKTNKITFTELYEMYSNEKMLRKLDSIAHSKNIEREDRLLWDLGVMVNEYPNYLKSKRKFLRDSESCKDAIENMKKYKISSEVRYKASREKTIEENKSSVKIDDIIDDMFAD